MSSSEQQIVNVVTTGRISNKLTLDSQEEQKREQQQQKYLEQIQKKKQQKRQRRQQAEKLERQKLKMQQEKQKVYQQPQKMFEQDSEDGIEYKRVVKKIKKMYPQLANKYDHYGNKKKNDFIVNDNNGKDQSSDSDSDSSGSSSSSKKVQKKKKIQKRPQKKCQKRPQKPQRQQKKVVQTPVKKQKIKIEPKTISQRKQNLVQQLSIRWWYALSEWPPANLDYTQKLKQLGYRVVTANMFASENDVVNGLQKVVAVEGYKGVFKSKTKLIDVRPKQTAPSLNNFRNMSTQQLNNLLRKALQGQIQQLQTVKYEQQGQKQLLTQLRKQLVSLK